MSQINELIAELCPDGVEFKALGDVGSFTRGNGLQKADLLREGVPAIHYGQVHTLYGTWTAQTKSFVSPELASKLRRAKQGDLVIATTSEDDDAVAKATAWLGQDEAAVSGDAYIYRHGLDPKYVAYFFQSGSFQEQKKRHVTGAKVRRISGESLGKICIPVPPLEVQREIVRVLDKFTQLEAELEAELEARRRQYEHLLQQIFARAIRQGTQKVPLRDIGHWYGGGTPAKGRSEFWDGGTIPWISPKDMGAATITGTQDHITEAALLNSATKLVPGGAVALVTRSSILDRILPIAYVPFASTLNQDMKAVVAREDVLPRYLLHALRASQSMILRQARRAGGSVASLDSQKLWKFQIPVPSNEEQQKVCKLLDKLDSLVNDLSVGLPAELAARRKQYEYYRDRLLTFEEKR